MCIVMVIIIIISIIIISIIIIIISMIIITMIVVCFEFLYVHCSGVGIGFRAVRSVAGRRAPAPSLGNNIL